VRSETATDAGFGVDGKTLKLVRIHDFEASPAYFRRLAEALLELATEAEQPAISA